jgi:hypothetical protein
MGRKKFIDKKNAFTFRLVHRDQAELTAFDDGTSTYVLEPVKGPKGFRVCHGSTTYNLLA